MRWTQWASTGFLLLVLCSCSSIDRGMIDNRSYYSSASPNIRIDIAEAFTINKEKSTSRRFEFLNKEERRFVLINFTAGLLNENMVDYYDHPSKWIFFQIPNCEEIEKGEIEILGKEWYFRDFVYHQSTASCSLMRDIGIFTEGHDVLKVLYAQELPPYQCKRWKGFYKLNGDQQKALDRFLGNMALDVKKSNYTSEKAEP